MVAKFAKNRALCYISGTVKITIMAHIASNFTPVKVAERKKADMRAGDTVRVYVKIKEKDKDKKVKIRLQAFEGLVLARKHGAEPGATFTVRKVTGGIGVERTFPLYSPIIDKIEVVRRSKTRRSKLYYIREKVAREIRRKMRNERMAAAITPEDEAEILAEELGASAEAIGNDTEETVETTEQVAEETK